jgi:hypothetical protein
LRIAWSSSWRATTTTVASNWVREQKLDAALPNAPRIRTGEVVTHKTCEPVQA